MRLDDDVGPTRCQRKQASRIVVIILQLQRFQPGTDIIVIPAEQNTLLIGAGTDDDAQAGRVLRLPNCTDSAIRLDEKAVQPLPVRGKIEFLLALFGDPDIGNDGIIFARYQAKRPVDPGDRYQFQFQPQTVGDGGSVIRVGSDDSLCIRRIGRKRRPAGADRDCELAGRNEGEILCDGCNGCVILLRPDAGRAVQG